MKTGKWSCVSQIDSQQFGNCPMQWDNEFHWDYDQNPAAWRSKDHYEWVKAGHIPNEKKIESFYRNFDVDTVDDFYVEKEIILGKCINTSSSDFTGWSVVLKTVIKWEEKSIRQNKAKVRTKVIRVINNRPSDIQQWEQTHGTFRSSVRNGKRSSRPTGLRRNKRASVEILAK